MTFMYVITPKREIKHIDLVSGFHGGWARENRENGNYYRNNKCFKTEKEAKFCLSNSLCREINLMEEKLIKFKKIYSELFKENK
jgi:hypothetical protein